MNILISLFIKIAFGYLSPLIDVKCYKEKYEDKNLNWFWKFIFKETTNGHIQVKRYRIFQIVIHIIFWVIAYIIFYRHFAWYILLVEGLGVFLSWYYMLYERLYYKIAKQEYKLIEFQIKNLDCYWLRRIYFSGYFFFSAKTTYLFNDNSTTVDNGFRLWKFDFSALIGIVFLVLSSLIFLI